MPYRGAESKVVTRERTHKPIDNVSLREGFRSDIKRAGAVIKARFLHQEPLDFKYLASVFIADLWLVENIEDYKSRLGLREKSLEELKIAKRLITTTTLNPEMIVSSEAQLLMIACEELYKTFVRPFQEPDVAYEYKINYPKFGDSYYLDIL